MTRRDYQLLAENFASLYRGFEAMELAKYRDASWRPIFSAIVANIGADLAIQNPSFDIKRFFKDCGIKPDPKTDPKS